MSDNKYRTYLSNAREKRQVQVSEKLSATTKHRINVAKQHLDLRDQNLSQIPSEVYKIGSQLKSLLLGSNSLTSLPHNFATVFSNLQYLDLSDNQLTIKNISNTLSNLDSLVVLDLEGNPEIESVPRFLKHLNGTVIVNPEPNYSNTELPQLKSLNNEGDEEEDKRYEVRAYVNDGTYHTDEEDYVDSEEEQESYEQDEEPMEDESDIESTYSESVDISDEATLFFAQLANAVDISDDAEVIFRKKLSSGDPELKWYIAHRFRVLEPQPTQSERQAARWYSPLGVSRKDVDDSSTDVKPTALKYAKGKHTKYANKGRDKVGTAWTKKDRKIKEQQLALYDE